MTIELDHEEFEDALTELRDYLRASDLVSAAKNSPEEARENFAALLAVVRHTAESISMVALVLRRVPASRERNAQHLEDLADALKELVLDDEIAEESAA